jgi:hypothetical protein
MRTLDDKTILLTPKEMAAMRVLAHSRSVLARAREVEERTEQEMLASARATFPELRRRQARVPDSPPVRPGTAAHVVGEGVNGSAPSLPTTHRAGWYSRRGGAPVKKDVQREGAPGWGPDAPSWEAPSRFPDGLNVE